MKNPGTAPRSLIFFGGRGEGKTSSLRIFARALNCQDRADGDCCNKCEACLSIRDGSPLYSELDSAVVGNVEYMKSLRDSFAYSVQQGYKVVGFDECHLVSKAAQSSLLSVIEEAPKGVFFVFLTTDPDRLLPTIFSRSMPIEFRPLTDDVMTHLLTQISSKESIELTAEVITHICRRVRGFARDAVQQLELVKALGIETYLSEVKLLDEVFEQLIEAFKANQKDVVKSLINDIVSQPVMYIEQDFELFIKKKTVEVFLDGNKDKKLKDVIMFYLRNHRYLRATNDWFIFLSALSGLFEQQVEMKTNLASRFSKV